MEQQRCGKRVHSRYPGDLQDIGRQRIDQLGRGLGTRLKEHKRDVRNHNRSNTLVLHIEKCEKLPNWEKSEIIEKGITKSIRKALEAAHISLENTVNEKREAGLLHVGQIWR